MLSDDETGSQLGLDLLINAKRVTSTDGSNRSFDMRRSERSAVNVGADDADDDGGSSFGSSIDSGDDSMGSGGQRGGRGAKARRKHYSSSGASSEGTSSEVSTVRPSKQEDVLNAKRELLYQFARLEKKGIRVPKHYTMTSDLDEMRADFERLKRDVETDASVRFQRRMLMAFVSGVEFLNHRFDPFDAHLDGWSESVQDGINEYDDIFEELHVKYHGKMKMAPELRLMMTLGGSAVWFHMSNSMFRSTMPGIDQIFKQNPELKQQFMSATMKTMHNQQPSTPQPPQPNQQQPPPHHGAGSVGGGLFGSLGNMMGGLFNGRPATPQQHGPTTPRPPPAPRPSMRGPSDVDDILSEINDENFSEMNEVLEIFSNASSSGEDVVSIDDEPRQPARRGGRRMATNKSRRTLDLD